MKYTLKNRPSHRGFAFGEDSKKDFGYARDCIVWFEGFEKEMRESLAYHDKMVDHWENKVSESHPLYRYREQIAGEWRVARGILTAVLGVEPKIKEEMKR